MNIKDKLCDTITLQRCIPGEYTPEGLPVHGLPVEIPARVEYRTRMVRNRDGAEVISDIGIWTADPIAIDDRVTFDGWSRLVLTAGPLKDFDGSVSHYEARL